MTENVSIRQKIENWKSESEDLTSFLTATDLISLVDDRDFLRDVIREMKSKFAPHSDKAIYFGKILDRSISISGE